MPKGGWRLNAGRPGGKGKVEHRTSLDVRWLQREGFLRPGHWCSLQWSRNGETCASIRAALNFAGDCLTLSYRWTPRDGEPVNVECPVYLDTTPCHYGGGRTWFTCPQCGRRCAIVYFAGARFDCRRCLNLAYASQSDDAIGRMWREQRKIERKLSGGAETWNHRKPKGMHQKTFDRLRHHVYDLEERREDLIDSVMARWMPGFR